MQQIAVCWGFFFSNRVTVFVCVHGYFKETDSCSHSNTPGRVLHSHFSTMDSSLFLPLTLSIYLSVSLPLFLSWYPNMCEPNDHQVVSSSDRVKHVSDKPVETFSDFWDISLSFSFSLLLSLIPLKATVCAPIPQLALAQYPGGQRGRPVTGRWPV